MDLLVDLAKVVEATKQVDPMEVVGKWMGD